ncbi:MAG: hypothetical protein ACE5JU_14615, partial [Candidatus Binatia bacterium]
PLTQLYASNIVNQSLCGVGKLRYQVYVCLASATEWLGRKLSNLSEELFYRAMKIRKGKRGTGYTHSSST